MLNLLIKDVEACRKLGIEPPPKITVLVVGKRHHVRFFPMNAGDGDKSGNCPAGTVVDRDVGHPTEFDFYLQSHGGLLGTSRPAHYNVLLDENNFTSVVHSLSRTFLMLSQSGWFATTLICSVSRVCAFDAICFYTGTCLL